MLMLIMYINAGLILSAFVVGALLRLGDLFRKRRNDEKPSGES